jgi:hypothetical protein
MAWSGPSRPLVLMLFMWAAAAAVASRMEHHAAAEDAQVLANTQEVSSYQPSRSLKNFKRSALPATKWFGRFGLDCDPDSAQLVCNSTPPGNMLRLWPNPPAFMCMCVLLLLLLLPLQYDVPQENDGPTGECWLVTLTLALTKPQALVGDLHNPSLCMHVAASSDPCQCPALDRLSRLCGCS